MVRCTIVHCKRPNNFKNKTDHLRSAFSDDDYPESIIDKFTCDTHLASLKESVNNPTPNTFNCGNPVDKKGNEKIWLPVPCDPCALKPSQSICKKINVNLGACKATNIGQMLVQRRPKPPPLKHSGGCVYKIPCKKCNTFYIGETVQRLALRITQHKTGCETALRTQKVVFSEKNDCSTAKHTLDTGHCWDTNKTSILASVKFEKHRKLCESAKIYRHKKCGITLANVIEGAPTPSCWHELL